MGCLAGDRQQIFPGGRELTSLPGTTRLGALALLFVSFWKEVGRSGAPERRRSGRHRATWWRTQSLPSDRFEHSLVAAPQLPS